MGLKEVTEKAVLQLLLLHPHGGNDRFFLVATSLLASEDSSEVTVDWTALGSADGSQISRGNVSTNLVFHIGFLICIFHLCNSYVCEIFPISVRQFVHHPPPLRSPPRVDFSYLDSSPPSIVT